jgi:hypothetical protein
MRRRLLASLLSGLVGVGLAGCASPQAETEPAAPAPRVCAGIPKCKVVARTDVDGDGVRDQVGFVVPARDRVVVHVATASGDRMRRGLDTVWFPRGEFYGATPIDGRPGAELAVGTLMGAHTLFFTTLTARDGRLVVLDAPGARDEWMIDGAFSFHAGVTRRVRDGRVTVVLREAERVGHRSRFRGRDRAYVWQGGGWQLRSTRRTSFEGERSVTGVGGWHVGDLPRFPQV